MLRAHPLSPASAPSTGKPPVAPPTEDDWVPTVEAMRGWALAQRTSLVAGALVGLFLGAVVAALKPAYYRATTTVLVSSGPSADLSQLRGLASQFGLAGALGGRGEEFPPDLVAGLAKSTFLLVPIVMEVLPESMRSAEGQTLAEVLRAKARGEDDVPAERRLAFDAVRRMSLLIDVGVERRTGAISLSVRSRAPDLSSFVAMRIVAALDSVVFDVSRQRAAAERRSAEERIAPQERRLRDVELRVASFLRGNRDYRQSPELSFQLDRLQSEVELQQQVLASLAQAREQTLAREIQSSPSLSVVVPAVSPVLPEPRRRVLVVLIGVVAGTVAGVAFAQLHRATSRP